MVANPNPYPPKKAKHSGWLVLKVLVQPKLDSGLLTFAGPRPASACLRTNPEGTLAVTHLIIDSKLRNPEKKNWDTYSIA